VRARLAVLAAAFVQATSSGAHADPVPPRNPYAGPDGTSSMHGDSAASDTTPYDGPGATPAPPQ
jgi:hypothetical protein